jgi:hypothetical protein
MTPRIGANFWYQLWQNLRLEEIPVALLVAQTL